MAPLCESDRLHSTKLLACGKYGGPGPLLPVGPAPSPETLHDQIRGWTAAWNKHQQGMCPQDSDCAPSFPESGSLAFDGQNLAQVVEVS
jgi:hypothetical protein